jgi:hypothetical protein
MAEPKGPRGSITQTADAQNERIQGISNVAKTVNAMSQQSQRQIDQMKMDVESDQNVKEISSSMTGVLDKLNQTIAKFGDGVKEITVNTAKATSDAISQYSKAVGEDISFNKRNIIAMSLARATPLFGYFAAKFMETDIFKNAAEKMKTKIGDMFGGLFGRFRGKKPDTDEYEVIPKMQKGGYVKKGGLVEVHAGEIVAPVEKVLARIDEQQKESVGIFKYLRRAAFERATGFREARGILGKREEEKRNENWFRSFFRNWKEAKEEEELPMEERQLRTLIAIQDALGAEYDTREQFWSKFLLENPTFRILYLMGKGIYELVKFPFRAVYSLVVGRAARWKRYLSRSSSPLTAMNENIATLFAFSMPMLNRIQLYTKAGAEATRDISSMLTGKRYPKLPELMDQPISILGFLTRILFFLPKLGSKIFFGGFSWLIKKYKPQWENFGKAMDFFGRLSEGVLSAPTKFFDWISRADEDREFMSEMKAQAKEEKKLGKLGPNKGMFEKAQELIPHLKQQSECCKITGKVQQKQLETTQKVLMIEDKQWRLQKENVGTLKRIRKGLVNNRIWQLAMGAFGMLQSFMGVIVNLGKGLVKDFMAGIDAIFPGLLPGIAKMLTNPTVLAGAVAGALGWEIGSYINDKFLKPLRLKFFKDREEQLRESRGMAQKFSNREWKLIRKKQSGKITGVELKELQRLQKVRAGLRGGASEELRRKKLGSFRSFGETLMGDQDLFNIVTDAQSGYAIENYNRYAKFSPEVIEEYRTKWLNSVRGVRGDPELYRKNPVEAGRKREEMFLQYLEKNAPTSFDYLPEMEEKTSTRLIKQAKGEALAVKRKTGEALKKGGAIVSEKIKTMDVDTASYAIDEGVQTVANRSVDIQNQLLGENKEMRASMNRMEQQLGAGLTQINTNVSNSITSAINSPSGQAVKGMVETAHGTYTKILTEGAIK